MYKCRNCKKNQCRNCKKKQDTDCKKKQCQMYTNGGFQCEFTASIYIEAIDKCVCGIHEEVAKKLISKWKKIFWSTLYCDKKTYQKMYIQYKNVCNNIRRCHSDLTRTQLINLRDILTECRNRRIAFTEKCFRENSDRGQKIQIQTLENGILNCNRLLNRK